jgi:hypothetical protein
MLKRLFSGLWQHADFRNLWAAETVSLAGSQITTLALPLTAVLILHAGPVQMGILRALATLPTLLFGLGVGVLVDRVRQRPLLISMDVGRAVLLGSIPLAALLGILGIGQLYLITFTVGVLTLLFDVAHMAYLPALIEPSDLVEGNSKLEQSRSGAMLVGPGLAGVLIQLVTAPIVVVLDALSFLGSAWFLGRIRQPGTALRIDAPIWRAASDGITLIARQPILRAIAGSLALYNFFSVMLSAVYVLYVVRGLGVSAGWLGAIYTLGSVGFLIGASVAGAVQRRWGYGSAIIWGAFVSDAAFLLIPLAPRQLVVAIPLLIAAQFFATLAGPITAINQLSLRQAIIPRDMQGRVNGTLRFLVAALTPLAALLGGLLASKIGLQPTILLAACGMQLGFLRLFFSPLRIQRDTNFPLGIT